MSRLRAGEELSDVMDDLADLLDIRSTQGMMGLVTNGQLHRGACYEHGVLFALAPFVSPQQYWDQAAADRVSKKARAQAQAETQA
jgi:non-canonical (house-cleaning) NTP pyrophosphatase